MRGKPKDKGRLLQKCNGKQSYICGTSSYMDIIRIEIYLKELKSVVFKLTLGLVIDFIFYHLLPYQ